MYEYFPIIAVGAIIGVAAIAFVLAYALMKNKKTAIGFDRHMSDGEIVRRLSGFAKPHIKAFVAVLFIMALTIAYDIISPVIVGVIKVVNCMPKSGSNRSTPLTSESEAT